MMCMDRFMEKSEELPGWGESLGALGRGCICPFQISRLEGLLETTHFLLPQWIHSSKIVDETQRIVKIINTISLLVMI